LSEVAPDRTDVLGRRIGAALLDILILALAFVAWSAVTGGATSGDGRINFSLHGGAAVAWFGFAWLYYIVCEAAWAQTPGKRALGIAVASEDGGRATVGEIVIRNLLRVIDGLPLLYLLGFLVALTGGKHQRLGDRAANTVVVRA
jgi:uncharacterized RDD family membrane protein YckC